MRRTFIKGLAAAGLVGIQKEKVCGLVLFPRTMPDGRMFTYLAAYRKEHGRIVENEHCISVLLLGCAPYKEAVAKVIADCEAKGWRVEGYEYR